MILGILAALIAGQSIAAILGGISLVGWLTLVSELAGVVPEAVKLLVLLHPIFGEIAGQLDKKVPHQDIARSVHLKLGGVPSAEKPISESSPPPSDFTWGPDPFKAWKP